MEAFEPRILFSAVLLKDINLGSSSSNPQNYVVMGNETYFIANDGIHGNELWKTDGTTAGTAMVADINPGSADANIGGLIAVGNKLFFNAYDGSESGVWVTDGTAAGTHMVNNGGYTDDSVSFNGKLFFDGYDPTHGYELWSSDGTAAGTSMAADINSGTSGSYPNWLTVSGSTLFFAATDPTHGNELWKTDGTAAGTVLVKDINPGSNDSIDPQVQSSLIVSSGDGGVYVYADDGTHGTEMWKSDGTESGTYLIKDLTPGSAGSIDSNPVMWTYGGVVYSAVDDPQHPFSIDIVHSDGTAAGTSESVLLQ